MATFQAKTRYCGADRSIFVTYQSAFCLARWRYQTIIRQFILSIRKLYFTFWKLDKTTELPSLRLLGPLETGIPLNPVLYIVNVAISTQ